MGAVQRAKKKPYKGPGRQNSGATPPKHPGSSSACTRCGKSLPCAGMVVVPKSDDKVRICVDLTGLNQNVCRERHQMPAVDQTLAQLAGAIVFLKLDANSGFWQLPLSPESALLTTFMTPFGRFCFKDCHFNIRALSAPHV